MEISGRQEVSSNAANRALASLDFFKQLTRAGPMPARVSSISHGRAVLLTQLGQVTSSNALDLKPGDQLQIRASGTEQQPVLKISRPITINSFSHPSLSKQIPTDRAVTALITGQHAASTKIQLGDQQFSIPRQQNLNTGQLISLTRQPGQNLVEIRPIDHQQVLKAAITRLLPNQPANQQTSGLTQLVKLIHSYSNALKSTTGEPPPTQGKLPLSKEGIANKAAMRPANPLQTLLDAIPRLSKVDKTVLQQWVSRMVATTSKNPEAGRASTTPESFLQLLPKTEASMVKMLQQLAQQIAYQSSKSGTPAASEIKPQLDDQLQVLARDIIKLTDQSTGQQLLQHTSMRYQQELQQPLAFNLAIPLAEEQKTRELQLKIRQRHQTENKHQQFWDIHFNFEFGLLGMISTHLQLEERTLSASFWSELSETQNKIENNLPSFRKQLVRAGLEPGLFHSFKGSPPEIAEPSPPIMPASLLDIRV
ncbi:MAG: flagellar hook-length control protein FliK [Gammaproteobacteria bacterium]|nr:flagellar hook-length control protein FliK [Gammaproteobacteria bacterium]